MKKSERKEQFIAHRKQIQEDYDRKMEALFILFPEFRPSSVASVSSNGSRGRLANVVRQAFGKREVQFTLREMAQWITEIDASFAATVSNIQLSNTLSRLAKKGELEKVPGVSPTAYKRKGKNA